MSSARLLRASSQAPGLHHFSITTTTTTASSSFSVRNNGDTKLLLNNPDNSRKSHSSVVTVVTTSSETFTTTSDPTESWDCGDLDLVSLVKLVMVTFKPVAAVESKQVDDDDEVVKNNRFQMLIERAIFDCRFFALLAVAGSLLGSVLCFLEGCLLVVESYFHYLQTFSRALDQGHMMKLLIQAMDMFLVGTAMLVFGVGIHAMFVGSKDHKQQQTWLPPSNLFGLFHLKKLPAWVESESISQAKSKIGHAILMIIKVGLVDKFNNVPLVTSFDLACFAAAILVSSASTFLLSKLYNSH